MRRDSETRDAAPEGWVAWARGRAPREAQPRLRLLVHSDLRRVGWMSVPGIVPSGTASWLTVGRNDPPFAGAGDAPPRPLDDPYVSREQLRVRWLPTEQQFEVEPAGRRAIHRVDLSTGGSAETSPITGPTRLDPGAGIAIGDRVLLALTLGGFHPPLEDRLGLVGETEAAWAMRDEIRSVAAFGGSALVTGPTGAGKELVARALHAHSPHAAGPFVPVNCASLPDSLVESMLFGHRRGAFTGATGEEKGLFRAADGGTLFLDELGELPLSLQPKLLRVLQDGVVVPVGAHEGHHVDVRVVAATHRDLDAYVHAGKLREDLFHRLSAHVLRVPSLAERRFDIPEIFVHVLGSLRGDHPALGWLWAAADDWRPTLPIGFLADLVRRPWSGNVRELANLAQRTARLNLHPGAFETPFDDGGLPRSSGALLSPKPPGEDGGLPRYKSLGEDSAPSTGPIAVVPTGAEGDVPVRRAPSPSVPDEDTSTPSGSPQEEALLRTASETLGIARKTLLKLLSRSAMVELAAEADRQSLPDAERGRRLRAAAAEALLSLLEARDFNQSSVAAALGASRTTLIKLMDDLGLPRAADLDATTIQRARAQAGGDLDAAARVLRVSPGALKKRVTLLNLKE